MMGFVAALSSSMAFIVLIMSAQLLNLINVRAVREKEAESIQISDAVYNHDTNILSAKSTNDYSYYLSPQQVQSLVSTNNPVSLYCTYGKNFSLEIAKRISTYNYILLKNNIPDLRVELRMPEMNKSANKDSCYLRIDTSDKKEQE